MKIQPMLGWAVAFPLLFWAGNARATDTPTPVPSTWSPDGKHWYPGAAPSNKNNNNNPQPTAQPIARDVPSTVKPSNRAELKELRFLLHDFLLGRIGAELTQMTNGSIIVKSLVKGMPAETTGLQVGDKVLQIDSQSTDGHCGS